MFQRLVKAAPFAFDVAKAIERGREVGTQAQGILKLLDRLVTLAHGLERQAEVGDGLRVVRPQADGRAAATGGTVVLTDGPVRLRQIGVKHGVVRLRDNRLAHQLDRACVVTLLMIEDAQQVSGLGVPGVVREDPPGTTGPLEPVDPPDAPPWRPSARRS